MNQLTVMLQEERKVATACTAICYTLYYYSYFYIAIWPIILLVIHGIVDKVSEIDHFGEILIRIEFSQVVNQL